jgi:hypothetical protein
MQPKELFEKVGDLRFGVVAVQLIRPEPVDLIAGEAQFAVRGHHVRIDLQRRTPALREVVLAIDLQNDALMGREEQQDAPGCSTPSRIIRTASRPRFCLAWCASRRSGK